MRPLLCDQPGVLPCSQTVAYGTGRCLEHQGPRGTVLLRPLIPLPPDPRRAAYRAFAAARAKAAKAAEAAEARQHRIDTYTEIRFAPRSSWLVRALDWAFGEAS